MFLHSGFLASLLLMSQGRDLLTTMSPQLPLDHCLSGVILSAAAVRLSCCSAWGPGSIQGVSLPWGLWQVRRERQITHLLILQLVTYNSFLPKFLHVLSQTLCLPLLTLTSFQLDSINSPQFSSLSPPLFKHLCTR